MGMKDILNKFDLTPEEKDFADKVAQDLGYNGDMQISAKAQVFATMYLAKQIERASESSDKNSRAMKWLTAALVLFTFCQVLIAIIK